MQQVCMLFLPLLILTDTPPILVSNNTFMYTTLPGISNNVILQFIGIIWNPASSDAYQISVQVGTQKIKNPNNHLDSQILFFKTRMGIPSLVLVLPTLNSNTIIVNIKSLLSYQIYLTISLSASLTLDFGSSFYVKLLAPSVNLQIINGNSYLQINTCDFKTRFHLRSNSDINPSPVFPISSNNGVYFFGFPTVLTLVISIGSDNFSISVLSNFTSQQISNGQFNFNMSSAIENWDRSFWFSNIYFQNYLSGSNTGNSFSYMAVYSSDLVALKGYLDCGVMSASVSLTGSVSPNAIQNLSVGLTYPVYLTVLATDQNGIGVTYDYLSIYSGVGSDPYPSFTTWTVEIVAIVFASLLFCVCVANVVKLSLIKNNL